MIYSNFYLLKEIDSDLYTYATDAENYIYTDAQSCLIKLRCFAEKFVSLLYLDLYLQAQERESLLDKMKRKEFIENVPISIQQKLHLLRMWGNKAAHGNKLELNINDLIDLNKESYFLGKWFFFVKKNGADYPEYIPPKEKYTEKKYPNQILNLQEEIKISQEKVLTQKICDLSNEKIKEKQEEKQFIYSNTEDDIDFEQDKTLSKIKLEDCYNEYQLTDGQKQLVCKLSEFLVDKETSIFLLKGYAGTGKTFITKGLTDYLDILGRSFTLSAPTGKASKVLAKKTEKNAKTIHSLIYSKNKLVEYRDENKPDTYKFYLDLKTNELPTNTVYIIDESSMISDKYMDSEFIRFGSGKLLKDLLKFINLDQNNHNKKIIFIGDDSQLPPIGMNYSPALDTRYLFNKYGLNSKEFELVDVVRQKQESGIIDIARTLRTALKKDEFNHLKILENYKDVILLNEDNILNAYLDSCDHKINGESIILAYSNALVLRYNQMIRQHFFPNQNYICPGDKVMSLRNITLNNLKISNGDFGLVRKVNPNMEKRVITLRSKLPSGEIKITEVPLQFREIEIGFNNEEGKAVFINTKIIENALYSDCGQLSSDENKALYIDFCIRNQQLSYRKNKGEFTAALMSDPYFNALPLKFGYAITCHKAQGSEWNSVFIQCQSHQNQLTRDYFRWFYTAITRSAKNLYLMNPPNRGLSSGFQVIGADYNEVAIPISETNRVKKDKDLDNIQELDTSYLSEVSKQLYNKVLSCICNLGVTIQHIEPKQYHDIYILKYQDILLKYRIFYNGKYCVSKIDILDGLFDKESGLDFVYEELIKIKDFSLKTVNCNSNYKELGKFSYDFLNEYHNKVIEVLSKNNIEVIEVNEKQYNLRYHFKQNNDFAIIDFYFNAKHQFGKVIPIKKSSPIFVQYVVSIIEQGLA